MWPAGLGSSQAWRATRLVAGQEVHVLQRHGEAFQVPCAPDVGSVEVTLLSSLGIALAHGKAGHKSAWSWP